MVGGPDASKWNWAAGDSPLSKAYGTLGVRGANQKRANNQITEVTDKSSRWLWMKRGDR